jgi:hypothetical protein
MRIEAEKTWEAALIRRCLEDYPEESEEESDEEEEPDEEEPRAEESYEEESDEREAGRNQDQTWTAEGSLSTTAAVASAEGKGTSQCELGRKSPEAFDIGDRADIEEEYGDWEVLPPMSAGGPDARQSYEEESDEDEEPDYEECFGGREPNNPMEYLACSQYSDDREHLAASLDAMRQAEQEAGKQEDDPGTGSLSTTAAVAPAKGKGTSQTRPDKRSPSTTAAVAAAKGKGTGKKGSRGGAADGRQPPIPGQAPEPGNARQSYGKKG